MRCFFVVAGRTRVPAVRGGGGFVAGEEVEHHEAVSDRATAGGISAALQCLEHLPISLARAGIAVAIQEFCVLGLRRDIVRRSLCGACQQGPRAGCTAGAFQAMRFI